MRLKNTRYTLNPNGQQDKQADEIFSQSRDNSYLGPEFIVKDIDGNSYTTIIIGDQIWLTSNLKVTHFNNGDVIPFAYTNEEWAQLSTPAGCSYNQVSDENIAHSIASFHLDDSERWSKNGSLYGCLYNWFAVNDPRGIAPRGWHIPTDEEWRVLEKQLGMTEKDTIVSNYYEKRGNSEGSKLGGRRELWINDYDLTFNSLFGESGFNALPGGKRYCDLPGNFRDFGSGCYFWTSSESNNLRAEPAAWFRSLQDASSNIFRSNLGYKNYGFSVRCVKNVT